MGRGPGSSWKNSALSTGEALWREPQRVESAPEWAQRTAVARMSAEDCSHCSSRWENAGDLGLVTFDMPGYRRLRDGEMRRGARGEGDKGWRMEPEKNQGQGEDVLKQVSQTCFFAK